MVCEQCWPVIAAELRGDERAADDELLIGVPA